MTTRNILTVKTALKAGGLKANHNQSAIVIKTNVNAGAAIANHNQSTR